MFEDIEDERLIYDARYDDPDFYPPSEVWVDLKEATIRARDTYELLKRALQNERSKK